MISVQLLHLGIGGYLITPLVNGAQGRAIQSGSFHLPERSLPGQLQVAEIAFELPQSYPPDAGDIIEAYPVFNIGIQSNFNSNTSNVKKNIEKKN